MAVVDATLTKSLRVVTYGSKSSLATETSGAVPSVTVATLVRLVLPPAFRRRGDVDRLISSSAAAASSKRPALSVFGREDKGARQWGLSGLVNHLLVNERNMENQVQPFWRSVAG